jgi:alpha-beta hydrolase superfamily lysophospholipase
MTPRRTQIVFAIVTSVVLSLAPPAPSWAADGRGTFVMTALGDTIAIERFERRGERLEVAMLFRLASLRFDHVLTLEGGTVRRMETAVRPAGAASGTAPSQSAVLEWQADSVIADSHPGKLERLRSRRGSIPYVNPSLVLLELVVQRALSAKPPLDSVPVFAVTGGRTLMAGVRRVTPDSLVLSLGSVDFTLHVRPDGSIESGGVPSQLIVFHRTDAIPEGQLVMAPQDYLPPVGAPYTAESVRVPTRGGFELAGTLTWPRKPGKLPCVVTITGSGPQERDEAIPMVRGYRPFRQIADTLARRGIAVLRLDDRGTGASGGRFAGSTSADFADDVQDALRWLRGVKDIDSASVALLGHSEGGLVAPLVALREPGLRALVLMAAPAWTGRRIMEYQNANSARAEFAGAAYDSVMRAAMEAVDSLAAGEPWTGFFARHDTLTVARRLARPPVLIVQGATDRQVSSEQAGELAQAFRRAGNRDVTLRVLPATNHLFLPDSSGAPAGYSALAVRDIPPPTLGLIADWLTEQFSSQRLAQPVSKPREHKR